MGKPFEYIGALQCENRILRKKVADYESGERFQQIQMEHQKVLDEYRRQIKRLKQTIENLRKDVRKAWKWCEEAYEDALKELKYMCGSNFHKTGIYSCQLEFKYTFKYEK